MSLNQGPGIYSGEIVIPVEGVWLNDESELVDYLAEQVVAKRFDDSGIDIDEDLTREVEAESAAEASWERAVGK